MLQRGWIERDHPKEGDKLTSNDFHFVYSTKSKDIFRIPNLSQNL
jgi:hypothetical protein